MTDKRASFYYGRLRLLETLDQYERFEELITLCDTAYLGPDEDAAREAVRLRYLGEALWRTNQQEQAQALLSDLRQRLDAAKIAAYDAEHGTPAASDDKEDAKSSRAAKEKASKAASEAVKELDRALAHLEVWQLVAKNDFAGALERLKSTDGFDPLDQATLAASSRSQRRSRRRHPEACQSS